VLAGGTACGWTESWAVYVPCDAADGALAATVATDDILTVIPPSARAGDRMVTLPCEDEDATVRREGQLDLGLGGLCFKNADQPDLSLKVHFSPTEEFETWTPGSVPTSFFVSVQMMAPRFVCAG